MGCQTGERTGGWVGGISTVRRLVRVNGKDECSVGRLAAEVSSGERT